MIVYNPLAGGLLTGKHRPQSGPEPGTRFTLGATGELYRDRYWHSVQFEAVETLKTYCERRGWNLATASVAWVLAAAGNHVGDRRGQPGRATRGDVGWRRISSSTTKRGRAIRLGLVVDPTQAAHAIEQAGRTRGRRECSSQRSCAQTSRLMAQSGFRADRANRSRGQKRLDGASRAIARCKITKGSVNVKTRAAIAATSTLHELFKS